MSEVTNQDRKDLSKALGYANWSIVGLLIPFVGWLLAGMALSFIKTVPKTKETSARLKQVKKAAWTGIIISSLAFAAWGGYLKYNASQNAKEQARLQQQISEKAKQQDEQEQAEELRKARAQNGLNNCLNSADNNYSDYLKINATSVRQTASDPLYYMPQSNWDFAASQRKNEKADCYQKQKAGLFDDYIDEKIFN